ncbi:hypothetical protein R75483_01455 [Paraburkholderia domus]|nr:hypothetical protein R75483_01455 [Paraburkholderia domus]
MEEGMDAYSLGDKSEDELTQIRRPWQPGAKPVCGAYVSSTLRNNASRFQIDLTSPPSILKVEPVIQ